MRILLVIAVIVAVDRATKEIAVRRLTHRRCGPLRVVATGRTLFARDASPRELVIMWVAAVTCAGAALVCSSELRENPLVTVGLAAVLAGASSNLLDRLMHGTVVDFMALGRWPVFNFADIAILAGAALAGVSLL